MILSVLLNQIIIMFILMAAGFVLFRTGVLSIKGASDLGNILIRLIIPCVIIRSYLVEYSSEKIQGLALAALFALLALVISMAISYIIYGKRKPVYNFSTAFCNAGFIGIPLVQTLLGESGVFYLAAYIAFLNLFQWTYGVYILTGDRSVIKPCRLLLNPVLVALGAGIVLFVCRIELPGMIRTSVNHIANMNTPVAMIVMGVYLARVKLKELFNNWEIYVCSVIRLILIPFVILLFLYFIPINHEVIHMVTLIAACTPVGANIAIFAQQYGKDYELSAKIVCLSTILSAVTIPAFVQLTQMLLEYKH